MSASVLSGLPEELTALLRRQQFGVVSSIGPDGRPQAAVVGLALTPDGTLVFDTLERTNKAQNLRRDPRVAVVLWHGAVTAQLEGGASEPTGERKARAVAAYLDRFSDGHERVGLPGLTYFTIEPRWVRWTDFGTTPETVREWRAPGR